MTPLALDTSVVVPLLSQAHSQHAQVTAWLAGRTAHLPGHVLVESYSVLTRLPASSRVTPADAAQLLQVRFGGVLHLSREGAERLPVRLAALSVAGGATYDALVALTALEHGIVLGTRDQRARGTYAAVGASVEVVA